MRTARIAPALGLLMVPALALAMSVNVDFDAKADFSGYKTYAWGDCRVEGNPLVQERIISALEKQLSARGLKRVEGEADIRVVYHGSTRQDMSGDLWGYGPGPDWNAAGTTVGTYPIGTLVVDLLDAGSRRLVWRGVAGDTLSDDPVKHEKTINKAAEKMFARYPVKAPK